MRVAVAAAVACASSGGGAPQARAAEDPVAARVAGENVYRSEVLRTVFSSLKGRRAEVDAPTRRKLVAQVLEEMIDQRLVAQFLGSAGHAASDDAVDAQIRDTTRRLAKLHKTWPEYLKQQGYTKTTFRRQIAWRLSWKTYLDKTLTERMLEDYFHAHQAQYDGSLVRASHILLKADKPGNGAALERLRARASALRGRIASGEILFAEAARQFSQAPSSARGGDIGYFPRHGVQGPAFSKAAFALDINELSEPVVTPFGVHLIQVTDLRAGSKRWTDVREPLRRDATRELFERIATKQRAAAKIEYTDALSHFDSEP